MTSPKNGIWERPILEVVKLALHSRLMICIIQFLGRHLSILHIPDAFISPRDDSKLSTIDAYIKSIFEGYLRWDSHYFLHISQYGYTYENTLAFYPLYPYSIKMVTTAIQGYGIDVSNYYLSLLVGLLLNLFFFVMAAITLFKLTYKVFHNPKQAEYVTRLFCYNPASIFFSALYTESLFAWLSFTVMLKAQKKEYICAIVPLVLSILCRSNGFVNVGFVLYAGAQEIIARYYDNKRKKLFRDYLIYKLIGVAVICIAVFLAIQYYQYLLFCIDYEPEMPHYVRSFGESNNFVLAGNGSSSSWCQSIIPLPYAYVQKTYWNVGLFKYYEPKQVPNFLLATPILLLFAYIIYEYTTVHRKRFISLTRTAAFLKNLNTVEQRLFVYMVHGGFLACFCTLFVHIQVSTRLLASASPCLYWFTSLHMFCEKGDMELIKRKHIFQVQFLYWWYAVYFFIGTIMFANFLPWT